MSRRIALAVAALLCAGCGGKIPPTTVWSLPIPRTPVVGVDPEGAALGLGRFSAEPGLRTTDLTWREGEGLRLNHYAYHEWADYPDRMLRERLAIELVSRGTYSSVSTAPPTRGLDARLEGRLVEFDEWDAASGVSVRVGLQWSLFDGEGRLLAAELSRSEADARKSVEDVVRAFERACGELVRNVADAVGRELEERD